MYLDDKQADSIPGIVELFADDFASVWVDSDLPEYMTNNLDVGNIDTTLLEVFDRICSIDCN